MGGRGASSATAKQAGPNISTFKSVAALERHIYQLPIGVGKNRAHKLAKALKWADKKGFGDVEASAKNIVKIKSSTWDGDEYKAARLLAMKKL